MEQLRNKILSAILSISIMCSFSGCAKLNENGKNQKNEIEWIIEDVLDEALEDSFENEKITKYYKKLDKIKLEYNYPNYYYKEEDMNVKLLTKYSQKECDGGPVGTVTVLYNQIVRNSEGLKNSPFNWKYEKDEKKYICETFEKALFKALEKVYFNDSDSVEDYCKLKNIKIIEGDLKEYNAAGLFSDKLDQITIDYDGILENIDRKSGLTSFEKELEEVLHHELNHARQHMCNCRKENGQKNSTIFCEALRNIAEASAESQKYTEALQKHELYSSTERYVYAGERISQSYLMLYGAFKKEFTLEKYYDSIFNSDLDTFYDIYNLDTNKDLKEFYNIAYALNTIDLGTELSTVLCGGGSTRESISKEVGNTYKISILKNVVKDLIERAYFKDITLDESLCLYNYVKAFSLGDSELSDKEILNINEIEKIFKDFICEYFKTNKTDVEKGMERNTGSVNILLDYSYSDTSAKYYHSEEILDLVDRIVNKYPIIIELAFANDVKISKDNYYLTRKK